MSIQSNWHIRLDDLQGPEVRALMEEHLEDMYKWSPPESVHALDLTRLQQSDIHFFTLWQGAQLLGSGALKTLSAEHAEIKSMRTTRASQGKGVGRVMLEHLLQEGSRMGLKRVSLETGTQPEFEPARKLYAAHGFEECGPFEGYALDPLSVFMTKPL